MQLADFDFPFDPSLVATHPIQPRDHARLLVLDRSSGRVTHYRVKDLPDLLRAGDLIVANDTKVLAARIHGHVVSTGKAVDMLLVRHVEQNVWEVLLKGKFRPGQVIEVTADARFVIVERSQTRTAVRMEGRGTVEELMQQIGTMPLPPYLKRLPVKEDQEWYQTVYARAAGAIAAPTAGLHFTEGLITTLRERKIEFTTVTLHVGPGTFRPVTVDRIDEHRMEAETVDVGEQAARLIDETRARGGRVVAIGTTVTRALESAAAETGRVQPLQQPTTLFIRPGFTFRAVDVLLTNFHLPRTTLLMLVSAFAGGDRLREAYGEAVAARYRFYSYGDAMLIQ